MNSATPLAAVTPVPLPSITVALLGCASVAPGQLQDTLALHSARSAVWTVAPADALLRGASVDIALCCYPVSADAAVRRWPRAAAMALVPDHDDGSAVQSAFDAGALACVRGTDPLVVAALVESVARRRGLTTAGTVS